jgi:hypothetical protein
VEKALLTLESAILYKYYLSQSDQINLFLGLILLRNTDAAFSSSFFFKEAKFSPS